MVLGHKPMAKLITFDQHLSVGQNKGSVWILGPQSLTRSIISRIYLSDDQNKKGVHHIGSPTLSPFSKDLNSSNLLLPRNYHTLPSIQVLDRTKVLHGPQSQTYGETNNS